LRGLNKYLAEPIEPLLLEDKYGHPCIEVKTPQELEAELDLPRGNIFHGDLSFPWRSTDEVSRWGVETSDSRILLAGAGSKRGGGVSGIGGHNAAMAALERI
jgi:phytoene dehydrogenase-like protein